MKRASLNKISAINGQGEFQLLKPSNRSNSSFLQGADDLQRIQGRFSPGRILAITIGGIALAEVIAMGFVYFFRSLPYYLQVFVDAAFMTVIIYPLLYILSFKPLLIHIQQRDKVEGLLQARVRLMEYANTHSLDELLQFTLDEIEALTSSSIGFFHFLEADEKTIWLQAWSTSTEQSMCKADGKSRHYDIELAGVWADAARLRQPVLHNNLADLPGRKGMPEGHAPVFRELVIPILRNNQVVGILGVGNKLQDYTSDDLETVSTLADIAWDIVAHIRGEDAVRRSEEKFRTLADWTYDWEEWVDPQNNIVYTSPSCLRITGYRPEEITADPGLLRRMVHPADRQAYDEHQRVIHQERANPLSIEFRILGRDGSEHWIEHICRPLFGADHQYQGRRISNRDITERKQAEKTIFEQNQRELVLNQTLQTIQTDIARDLHDTLGQNISFLRMNLEHLSESRRSSPPPIILKTMTRVANESYDLIRAMLTTLQTGNTADPMSLFTRYSQQVAERSSLQVDLTCEGEQKQLTPTQVRQLFYIFREALSNIEKHAQAERVRVVFLWGEHALTLLVKDNGRGFEPDAVSTSDHYGLKFMRERAEKLNGSLEVHSAPGQGTTKKVTIPYEFERSSIQHPVSQ